MRGATMPDGGGARAVRVRISGTFDSETDRADLEEWLLQEDWFKEHAREGLLRIERPDGDPGEGPGSSRDDGPPMGGLLGDILLIVVSASLQPVFGDLYDSIRTSVDAWRENRRVTRSGGEDPRTRVEEADAPDGATGDAPEDEPGTGGAEPDPDEE
jgi:hypothetical protein